MSTVCASACLLKRRGHAAVTWKDSTVVWGGCYGVSPFNRPVDPSLVLVCRHPGGEWVKRSTGGDAPAHSVGAAAVAVGGAMIVLGGISTDDDSRVAWDNAAVHSLDLGTWRWTRLTPAGTPPADILAGSDPWLHGGRIYVLKERLLCYNAAGNRWEWPKAHNVPSPRAGSRTVAVGGAAFLFGGRSIATGEVLNDLHVVDMSSLRFRRVPFREGPCARALHTLTLASESTAVLFGGDRHLERLGDCWTLDLDKARRGGDAASMWVQRRQHSHANRWEGTVCLFSLS